MWRRWRLGPSIVAGAAATVTLAFLVALPSIAAWTPIFPIAYSVEGADSGAAAEVLGNLSLSLFSLAVAIVVGAAILLRTSVQGMAQWTRWVMVTGAVMAAVTSIYSGFSFQVALADQIASYRLELPRLVDRLEWQAMAAAVGGALVLGLGIVSLRPDTAEGPPPRHRKRPRPFRKKGVQCQH